MDKEDELLEGQTDDEEDLFDLSLDDLSPEDIDQEPLEKEPDEEIIELMDLVEKGEKALDTGDGEMTNLLEDDQPTEGLGDIVINKEVSREEALAQEETELDLDDISLEPDLVLGEETDSEDGISDVDIDEGDLEKILEGENDEDMGMNLDSSVVSEESLGELIDEVVLDEPVVDEESESEEAIAEEDIDEGDLEKILEEEPDEDLDMTSVSPIDSVEIPESVEEEALEEPETQMEAEDPEEKTDEEDIPQQDMVPEKEEAPAQRPVEEMIGISEEKIEAIVTRVVGDVVERVTRETMTSVAEKVISEAIDALRESLDLESDSE
ncbi:hypothetical protein ACFLZG_04690 [Thermodesulfobacteriota bacterium]